MQDYHGLADRRSKEITQPLEEFRDSHLNLRGRVGSVGQAKLESGEEAESNQRTTRRKSAKERTSDNRGSGMSELDPVLAKRRGVRNNNKVEKTWAERVIGRTKDESETSDSD